MAWEFFVLRIGSDKLVIAALAVLTLGSVGLKGAVGAPSNDAPPQQSGKLEAQLSALLRAQGFSTVLRAYHNRSSAVIASRGACRLSVRNASDGDSDQAVYAVDAASIGPVRYLYRGKTYSSPPSLAMRLTRFKTEVKDRLGMPARVPIPLALASSPQCGSADFRLTALRPA